MNNPNLTGLEKEIEKKYQKKQARKKPKMKVSGGRVKKLSQIIKNKE